MTPVTLIWFAAEKGLDNLAQTDISLDNSGETQQEDTRDDQDFWNAALEKMQRRVRHGITKPPAHRSSSALSRAHNGLQAERSTASTVEQLTAVLFAISCWCLQENCFDAHHDRRHLAV